MGDYAVQIALAFQMVDDVSNLRGFKGDTKNKGEDITEGCYICCKYKFICLTNQSIGKITHPIAMAMSAELVPSKEARQSIYDRLKSKPNPYLYAKLMKEIQMEIDKLSGINDNVSSMSLLFSPHSFH